MITRKYLRKLIMETIYVTPSGQATLKGQQEETISPMKYAKAAKLEYNSLDQDDLEKLEMIFELGKLDPPSNLRFDGTENTITDDPDLLNQAISLALSLYPDIGQYLNSLYLFNNAGVSKTQKDLYLNKNNLTSFFPIQNPGSIGMGLSLVELVIDAIVDSIKKIKNMTPLEFEKRYYPVFEDIVDKQYGKMFQGSGAYLTVKLGYLEAISYVLRELIAEVNVEFTYGTGAEPKQPLFIPDDPSVVEDIKATNGFLYITDVFYSLRDDRRYYNTKFSINPALDESEIVESIKDSFLERMDWQMEQAAPRAHGLGGGFMKNDMYGHWKKT